MAIQVEDVVTAYREQQEAHRREEGCHGSHRGDLSELFKSWAVVAASIVLEFLCYQHIVSSNLMQWRAKDPELKVRMGVMQDTQLLEHSNGRMSMHVLCNEPMQVPNTIPSIPSLRLPSSRYLVTIPLTTPLTTPQQPFHPPLLPLMLWLVYPHLMRWWLYSGSGESEAVSDAPCQADRTHCPQPARPTHQL